MPAETRELLATWAGFQEELIVQFSPVNKTRNARDKLATCKQQDKESVRKYATRMREILITLPKVTEDEKLDRFIRNLKPDIRQEIEMTNPDSFDEAVQKAERIDATWTQSRSAYNNENYNYRNRDRGRQHNSGNGRTPMEVGSAKIFKPRNPRTPQEQKLFDEGKCMKGCGQKWERGHVCASGNKGGSSSKSNTAPGNGPWRQSHPK